MKRRREGKEDENKGPKRVIAGGIDALRENAGDVKEEKAIKEDFDNKKLKPVYDDAWALLCKLENREKEAK
eukprot:CAMPEP_0116870564 /NCGR_PEP_ID=MMETSP0463-20121206/502_1 /TAXON_ID=181622 /ORGANISM="Strombidinopsis sp, Strain SopsisLIS2011" /LENGTH=70 /DNA_ID=CAMNT_0004507287 /DNA_START=1352 /DNA_END=1564 /DNA_ORIENTATION=+